MRFSTEMLNGAACSGELSTVIWLHTEHTCALSYETTLCCARAGQIEVLRWLKQQGAAFEQRTVLAAAIHDQRATCAYLHDEGCVGDELAIYAAANAKGRFEQCQGCVRVVSAHVHRFLACSEQCCSSLMCMAHAHI
jgi:hypothetical protein